MMIPAFTQGLYGRLRERAGGSGNAMYRTLSSSN